VAGVCETLEERLSDVFELRAAVLAKERHAVEAAPPGREDVRLRRPAERQLAILDRETILNRETGGP